MFSKIDKKLGKTFKYYLLILFVSLVPLYNIFFTGNLIHTQDGLVHLPRIGAYFKALNDLQIPIRWAGDLNYGYGMPIFNFMYQFPYFFSSVFLFIGFGLVNSFKIVLILSFVLSGIFMFAFSNAFLKDERKALLVTFFYQFAPFRLVEILTRGSLGEIYTYTFLPLVLFGFTILMGRPNFKKFLLASFATALLIISHNALSLVFFLIAFVFILFFSRKKRDYFLGLFSLLGGLLLASFYWIPAIFEHKYTYGDLYMKYVYLSHFPPIQNFFIPNITNSPYLQTEKISVQFGLFHVLAIILSLFLIFFKRKINPVTKRIIIFGLVLSAVALFFLQPFSEFFWEKFSLLRQFQFPWRFLAVEVFATSLLSVSFFSFPIFKKKYIYGLLLFLLVISTVFYWKPVEGFDKINENNYWNFPLNTTYYGETDVVWSAGPAKSYPKKPVEVIGGKATVSRFIKKSNVHTFIVDAKTDVQLVDHTQYFPGWKVYVNGKQVPVQFQDQNWRGQITFFAPKGINNIEVVFRESKIRFIADMMSLFTIIMFLPLFYFRKKIFHEN